MNLKGLESKMLLRLTMLLGVLTTFSCSSKDDGANTYVKLVKTAKVKKISSENIKQYPGIFEETEEVNLAFRVAGPIQKILVKEGDFVTKGQVIAQMDMRDYEVQKKAIEAQVKQLQSEYKRIEELKNRKSVAENDYEKMKAGKEMAEAQLKNAEDQLKDTKLTAPFSGYISKVMFENGELVNTGTPIASMVDVSMLKVEVLIPPSLYINLDKVLEINCTQENLPGVSFPLTLSSNNIKANNNGLYTLYLYHKPEKGSKLAPGMNVSVNIRCSDPSTEQYSIPLTALYTKNNESFVWVVADSAVSSRKVRTNNRIDGGNIGIIEGLNENETIVVGGLNLLSEGEKVKPRAVQSETNVGNVL